MTEHDLSLLLIGFAVLLVVAKLLGELAKRFNIPAIFGELCAGILLGVTVFGKLFPDIKNALYPATGSIHNFYQGFNTLAVLGILLLAGIEIKFSFLKEKKFNSITVSILGIVFPFVVAYFFAYHHSEFLGYEGATSLQVFALFFGTAMSISALPVIAKTFMDLNIFNHPPAVITISAAIIDDIIGWIIFGFVLTLAGKQVFTMMDLIQILLFVAMFAILMLTVVKKFVDLVLSLIKERTDLCITFCLLLMIFCATITQLGGIHALFGAFFAGVILGDSSHLPVKVRRQFENTIKAFLAPLFFASLALHADFISNFDLTLSIYAFLIACFCKIVGCSIGAKISGMSNKDSFFVGVAMNSRGAMEIIIGTLALQNGLIGQPLFIALVVTALLTSLMAGPILSYLSR